MIHRLIAIRVLPALLAGLAFAGSACGGANDTQRTGAVHDPGPVHVHGLGVNPRDGALFIATHTGLFRAGTGEQQARRVAGRHQDTMGFTVIGPDAFLGSGHPDLREKLPPFLGLIRSEDAGQTWKPVSLQGKADFHVLEAARDRVYGFGADFQTREQRLLVSDDGGQRWRRAASPEPLVSLAIDPSNADHVVASGQHALHESSNAGRTWQHIAGEPGMLTWPTGGGLYLVGAGGRVMRSADPGDGWQTVGLSGGEPAAFEAETRDRLYVALHDGTIKESRDGGTSWKVRSQP